TYGGNMEVSSSALSGALKAGIQVVSAQKRPLLEIYHRVHNLKHPPHDVVLNETPRVTEKISRQEIFISFTLTNIGGERAENIKLSISGNMIRPNPRQDFGPVFKHVYPQMAPAHSVHLFSFERFDFSFWDEDGDSDQKFLEITMEYDLPKGVINRIRSLPWIIAKKRRYKESYIFRPFMVSGELPP
ncbi:TPA: hypothetical protein I7718_21205, partial [Vibrio vulnificus]|nr:hypothetical protein [Vibrio vulnificus]